MLVTVFHFHSEFKSGLVIVQYYVQSGKPSAHAKCEHKTEDKVKNDIPLVGLTGLAVVFCAAVLAFDMREHRWSERATPPGETDLLCIALSAVGAWGILGRVLHNLSFTISAVP